MSMCASLGNSTERILISMSVCASLGNPNEHILISMSICAAQDDWGLRGKVQLTFLLDSSMEISKQ